MPVEFALFSLSSILLRRAARPALPQPGTQRRLADRDARRFPLAPNRLKAKQQRIPGIPFYVPRLLLSERWPTTPDRRDWRLCFSFRILSIIRNNIKIQKGFPSIPKTVFWPTRCFLGSEQLQQLGKFLCKNLLRHLIFDGILLMKLNSSCKIDECNLRGTPA